MKKNISFSMSIIMFIMFLIIPLKIEALSVNEAGTVVSNYAIFTYEEQLNEFKYEYPVQNINLIYNGKYNVGNKYQMDCNTYVTYVILNAFQANDKAEIFSGNQVVKTNFDKWVSHSKYYIGTKYGFNSSAETMKSLVSRINIVSLLDPGDIIGFNAFNDDGNSYTHTAIYIGDGYYIHNTGSGGADNKGGLKKSKFPSEVSFGTRHGKLENGSIKGGITILKLQNTDDLSMELLNSIKYYDGYGNTKYKYTSNNSNDSSSSSYNTSIDDTSEEYKYNPIDYDKEFKKLIYFIGLILFVLRIAVPVALFLAVSIDLIKVITQNDDRDMKKVISRILPKVIAAVMVFILPSLIALLMKIVNQSAEWEEYSKCISSPISCDVELWD